MDTETSVGLIPYIIYPALFVQAVALLLGSRRAASPTRRWPPPPAWTPTRPGRGGWGVGWAGAECQATRIPRSRWEDGRLGWDIRHHTSMAPGRTRLRGNIRLMVRCMRADESLTPIKSIIQSTITPFNPKSDQCQISPAASPEILHHTLWRIWLFIAHSDERWLCYQSSLPHSLVFLIVNFRFNVVVFRIVVVVVVVGVVMVIVPDSFPHYCFIF